MHKPLKIKFNEFNMPCGCVYCGNKNAHEPNEFITFSGGVINGELSDEEKVKLVLSIDFHDDHSDPLEQEKGAGQLRVTNLVDLDDETYFLAIFCSFDCLKKWFIEHVEYLESHTK